MDHGNGIPVAEEQAFQKRKQSSWIPITPMKQEHGSRLTGGHLMSMDSVERMPCERDLDNSMEMEQQPTENIMRDWGKNMPFLQLLARTDAASAAITIHRDSHHGVRSFTPLKNTDIYNGSSSSQQSSSTALLLQQINPNLLLQKPQNVLAPYLTNYNLDSSQNVATVVPNGTISFQLQHGTSTQGALLKSQSAAPIDFDREVNEPKEDSYRVANQGKQLKEFVSNQVSAQPEDPTQSVLSSPVTVSDGLPHPINPSVVALSTSVEENNNFTKGDDKGIDLNKTPQPKSRRKKHRPKVIREGKPKRIPKPVKPKQPSNKENPSGKRKYVRKTGPKASKAPSSDIEKAIHLERAETKSCRRSLNFNLDEEAEDTRPNMAPAQERPNDSDVNVTQTTVSCTSNSSYQDKSQTQEFAGANPNLGSIMTKELAPGLEIVCNSPGSKLIVQHTPGQEMVLENSWTEFEFDLCSFIQEDYVSSPENSNPSTPFRKEKIKNKSIGTCAYKNKESSHARPPYTHAMETACIKNTPEAVCNKHEGRAHSGLQDDIQAAIKRQPNLNNKTQEHLAETICARKETKRKNSHGANDSFHSLNLNETDKLFYISSHSNNGDLCFPIHKKKRTVTKYGRFPSNGSNVSSLTAQHDHTRQVTSSTLNKDTAKHLCSATDQIAQNTLEEALSSINGENKGLNNNSSKALEAGGFLGLGQIRRRIKKKWNGSFEIRTLPTIAIATGHEEKPDISRRMAPTIDYRQANNTCPGPQPYMEALVADNNAVMKRKKSSNKGTEACRLYSLSSPNTNYVHQEDQTVAYDNRRSLVESRGTALNRSSRFQETSALSLSSLVPYKDPVEEIIQKFIMLNISGDSNSNMPGMLVHYVGDRTIVPYEPFQPTKKRRPRAKVDLDPETDRVWKLLMWNEGSDAAEERDAEKEKWWAEERQNFQGRAESFIARMHLVQGDRRFSKWKGSVVDSVVGVFLTQNVSDHLSSSAFMALAARFPVRSSNRKGTDGEGTSTAAEEHEACILDSDGNIQQDNRECEGCRSLDEAEPMEKQIMNLNELSESNTGCSTECGKEMCRESPESGIGTSATATDNASLTDAEDRQGLEEAASSQVSVLSSENSLDSTIHLAEQLGTSSGSNLEAEYQRTGFKCDDCDGSPSFTKLLQMAGSNMFQEFHSHKNEMGPFKQILQSVPNQSKHTEFEKRNSSIKGTSLSDSCAQIDVPNSYGPQAIEECKGMSGITYSDYQLHSSQGSSGSVDLAFTDASGDESRCSLPSNTCETVETNDIYSTGKGISLGMENLIEFMGQKNQIPSDPIATATDSCAEKRKNLVDASSLAERTEAPLNNDTSNACSQPHMTVNFLYKPRERNLEPEVNEAVGHSYLTEELLQNQNSELHKHLGDTSDVAESSSLMGEHKFIERMEAVLNSKDEVHGSRSLTETSEKTSKLKKERNSSAKKCENVDWDSLRKQACSDGLKEERSSDRMDSLDWEAVRCAEVDEIANTIRERGMNNRLAERIKDFLNRVVRDHGSIDLEWLRDVPPDKVKDYLLSIRGLGLKSVECIRLLTLHHLAFPVDTNVGRICVRLGWVPLQPLPESLQLHLLEMYPVLDSIQKYLWPRLCTLDQRTLYELHYQMITFGKVFCTKSKPNCNACPMRAECRHFASAFASARLALPGPEEKSIVSSAFHMTAEEHPKPVINLLPLPPMQGLPSPQVESEIKRCEPIIEEPTTPEHESIEASENEIEDAFWKEDPDEIPTIKLNFEEFTTNIQNYIQQNNIEMQDGDMSKALVSLTPEAASIPVPKLKNMSRLRTEHQVYELPDTHPLLIGLDKREPDDPCSYLLAIWTPGETAQSTQPPEICCNSQASGILCDKMTCFACNSVREAESQTVRGTLLIPCRTAMRGSFPLNGTYFQVNEVFADHDSSLNPIDVPRAWIWNLPRRTVYFGTSIPTIFRGLTTEGIQHCFWRGFVCIRGFDQKTRAPRPLMARLHFPASKLVKTRKKPIKPETPTQTATSMKS